MNTNELRQTFLKYFEEKGHTMVPSSSLVPQNDPTLLFTNAGMNQFKDVFLGKETRKYTRATSAQCCVRAGGKHNDLENVGFTARHHTFFEMLGNFSFGDYFKREAIQYAWDFLTNVLMLAPEKLWITVYEEDLEAEKIWLEEIGIDPKRFSRCGAKDNFWSMGDTGPCGPCSEIFYDHGEKIAGGPPGSAEQEGDRYVEIWNLVFMQYNRAADGELTPLPKPSVDTGMGLERIAAVMQGVHNNYDIDIFQNIIKAIQKIANVKNDDRAALNVVADHIRSSSFLIADGVNLSNEGRGYVLRRIIRRAVRYGNKLGIKEPFFYKLVQPLVIEMGDAYPQLKASQQHIEHVIEVEEKQFEATLEQGLKILNDEISKSTDNIIPGEVIFKLYDTYGFPPALTQDIAKENNMELDEQGFTREMVKRQEQSKQQQKFTVDYSKNINFEINTKFVGYTQLQASAKILGLIQDGNLLDVLRLNDRGGLVLDKTPFYAEAGGQVSDIGTIFTEKSAFNVTDVCKHGDVYIHYGYVDQGAFEKDFQVTAAVDIAHRKSVAINHSATHLLHAALRQVLGKHVEQKGSFVTAEYLRFDFSHLEMVSVEQLLEIENIVNQQIRDNFVVDTQVMSIEEAKDKGAMALFGEKYADEVRVVRMGEFSMELCGGTHAKATGDIGVFKVLSESGIAAGVRRIEAATGEHALQYFQKLEKNTKLVARILKTETHNIITKSEQTVEQIRSLEKDLMKLKGQLANAKSSDLTSEVKQINGINVLAAKIEHADMHTLRNTIDQLKQKFEPAVIILAAVVDDKILLASGVSKSITDKYHAGKLMQYVSSELGGKGGGRPDMAQGGGAEVNKLNAALESVAEWLRNF